MGTTLLLFWFNNQNLQLIPQVLKFLSMRPFVDINYSSLMSFFFLLACLVEETRRMEKKDSFPLFGWIEITNQGRWKLRGVGEDFPAGPTISHHPK